MASVRIKLVIWDLDETLWDGTLSEGEIQCKNGQFVKQLCEHGIINSISSKNDFDNAKAKLIELGLWDYFVFPSINWNPKGESVKQIIEDCQLRAANVVFIDDNPSNLKEVEYYNPGITTFSCVKELKEILELDCYKEDKSLKRLAQYKILENKKEYKEQHCSSNIEFLRESNIRIEIITELNLYRERLVDMISRTNQLNYTKKRIGLEELDQLLSDTNIECAAIHVIDNFGDYGISGFYAFNKHNNTLNHFLFSCRILNLGVEKYIFNKLGRPLIDIVEPVSTSLDEEVIDWITEGCFEKARIPKKINNNSRITIALLGGCDLEQMCHYFPASKFKLIKDFNYNGENNQVIHREHTVYLKKYKNVSDEVFSVMTKLPFLDENILDYKFRTVDFDYLVFSPLMNFTQEIYKHKTLNFEVAYGGYLNLLSKESVSGFTKSELEEFQRNYLYVGQQTPDDFIKDLEWLISVVKKPILFLNGADIDYENSNERGARERHAVMNKALAEFVKKNKSQCSIIDVNKYVKNSNDITNNIRHYQRTVYIDLAKEIMNIARGEEIKISILPILKQILKSFALRIYRILNK